MASSTQFLLIGLIAICLSALCVADPDKPKPPNTFTAAAFIVDTTGFHAVRMYYDGPNLREKYEFLDDNFQNTIMESFIFKKQGYYFAPADHTCVAFQVTFMDSWSMLKNAVYDGKVPYGQGSSCNVWVSRDGNGRHTSLCFDGNDLVFIKEDQGGALLSQTYFTRFKSGVDSNNFVLPSICTSNLMDEGTKTHITKSAMNFKRPFTI